ncbi:SixA phosphatase family protein [Rudanella lutea]|uniref:SixA phosphatase family protein n=1 Tax=Rudanella lutea TaxID=451374 RepID=UPI00036967FB|nr:histidine phosphatase family protein [Rudanella lutea]
MKIPHRLSLVIALGIMLLSAGCSTSSIYVVRHAERLNDSDTTSLSAAGLLRARALAGLLANAQIDSIYITPYRRTEQTAAPLATQLGLPLTRYPASPVTAITGRLRQLRGKNALVVGHSNTILEIARGLGTTPSIQKIEHADYQNLLFIRMRRTPFGQRAHLYEQKINP